MAGVAAGGGLLQAAFGMSAKKKAQAAKDAALANMPKYAGSPELDKYYQEARAQANTPAEQSAMYKASQNLAQRNLATGLGAASSAGTLNQGMVSKLVQGTNDATTKNLMSAYQQKENRFNRLGSVVGQKAQEGLTKFKINEMQPWETKFSDIMAQGQAGAAEEQAGFQNIFGALTSAAQMKNMQSMGKKGYYSSGYKPS